MSIKMYHHWAGYWRCNYQGEEKKEIRKREKNAENMGYTVQEEKQTLIKDLHNKS